MSGWVGGVGIHPAAVQRATKRTAACCVPRGGLLTVCPGALAHAGHATPSAAAKQRRYAISVEHAAFMEDIEVEDAASGLEASPLAATMLPPWMRAVQRVQEEFDVLNERECAALRCAMVCCAALREKCCAAAAGRRGWHGERARCSAGAVGARPARRGLRRTSGLALPLRPAARAAPPRPPMLQSRCGGRRRRPLRRSSGSNGRSGSRWNKIVSGSGQGPLGGVDPARE